MLDTGLRLNAPNALRPFTPRMLPSTYFCLSLSRPQDLNAAGRIRSVEMSDDLLWNRTHELPPFSVVYHILEKKYIIDCLFMLFMTDGVIMRSSTCHSVAYRAGRRVKGTVK
jgi:hypothetical protein